MGKIVKLRGVVFDVGSKGAILLGLDKDAEIDVNKELEIPTVIEGFPVTEIASGAFFQSPIKYWHLPATIHTIGDRAFGRSDVEKIIFYASSVQPYQGTLQVGVRAFKNCKNLKLFSTMQNIAAEDLAFCSCNQLTTESMRHEMRFSKINKSAFAGCKNLEEIFISKGAALWDGAFDGSALKKIHCDKNIRMHKSVFDFIKAEDVEIITGSNSEIVDLVYEGIKISVIKE